MPYAEVVIDKSQLGSLLFTRIPITIVVWEIVIFSDGSITAPQHLVCRVVPSLHINHMQMSIIEVFICRRLHMNTSMIPICIWLICRLCTALHIKCCGAVHLLALLSQKYHSSYDCIVLSQDVCSPLGRLTSLL